jgi:hypothetical protein
MEHFLNGQAFYLPAANQATAQASSCAANAVNGAVGMIGGGLKIGAHAVKRVISKPLTKNGGYQVQGIMCEPRFALGLTPGQNAVRVATYNQAAKAYLHEAEMTGRRCHTEDRCSTHRLVAGDAVDVRVVIPVAAGSDFAGEHSVVTCRTMVAEATGIHDARVYDIRVSGRHIQTARALADRCIGTPERNVPAYYFGQLGNKVKRDGEKSLKNGWHHMPHRLTFNVHGYYEMMEYETATKLILCAFILDRMQVGSYKANHFMNLDANYAIQAPLDVLCEEEDTVWMDPCDQLREFVDVQKEILGADPSVVPVIPASSIDGVPYSETHIILNEEELDGREPTQPRPGAAVFGPNIVGQLPPLDTRHEKTQLSAYSRHMCKVDKTIKLPDGEEIQVVVDKEVCHDKMVKEKKFWAEVLTDAHLPIYADFLQEFPQDRDSRPNSMSEEKYNAIQAEFDTSTEWGLAKALQACVFPKQKEVTDRARHVTMPGSNSADAAYHQAYVSPFVHSIEDFHSCKLNHTNFKGMSYTGKARRVAMIIDERPDDWVTVGFDKSANDRSVTLQDWKNMCYYFARMARVYASADDSGTTVPLVFRCDMKPDTKIRITSAMFTMVIDAAYYYLFSGVGPTALFNRFEVMVTVLAATSKHYGEMDAMNLLRWLTEPIPVNEECTDAMDFPLINKGYSVLTGDFTIPTPVRLACEGDDTVLSIQGQGSSTNSEVVSAFTRALCSFNQVWVSATVNQKHLDSHGGKRSCVEVMSTVHAMFREDGQDWYDARMASVPKPIKRLAKLAWSDLSRCRTVDTPVGRVLVADETYHRQCATKAFSLCMDLTQALFVRQVVFRTGEYHLHRLRKLSRETHPLYSPGTMEDRGLKDASAYIGDCLDAFHTRFQLALLRVDTMAEHVMEANANAWMLDTGCQDAISFKDLRALLLHLDFQASTIDVTWDHIMRPDTYLACFDFGDLTPFIAQRCSKSKDALEGAGGSTVPPLDVLRQGLLATSQKRLEPGPSAPRKKAGSGPSASSWQ